ncbi:hypothetical protein MTR67_003015 [Solanum verrucosum]|uniref:Polyprotein n=1 Tax=Solanum verrucosum TaxID=315347 RepID=A0AAF0PUT5_SOLVR|nr:hypothetical protein MTR67_003015 [Solanum verrucosum]
MYRDLKRIYRWLDMKKDIAEFVAKCQNCQQVKYEHQRHASLLQRMSIPKWKWERIAMDFMVGLPKTLGKFDSIWVVVDRLTKSTHFIPVRIDYNAEQLAKVYVKEIVRLHGVPLSIISDRDKVRSIQAKILVAQNRQKKYADHKVRDMEFQTGENVLLKGPVAYKLALPPNLSGVHPVFHVSILKRYNGDGDYIIKWDSFVLVKDLQYEKEPIAILDRDVRKLRTKEIKFVKVQWKHLPVEEATWEIEKDMRDKYPQLFVDSGTTTFFL